MLEEAVAHAGVMAMDFAVVVRGRVGEVAAAKGLRHQAPSIIRRIAICQ
jgi:hypothetical protein